MKATIPLQARKGRASYLASAASATRTRRDLDLPDPEALLDALQHQPAQQGSEPAVSGRQLGCQLHGLDPALAHDTAFQSVAMRLYTLTH